MLTSRDSSVAGGINSLECASSREMLGELDVHGTHGSHVGTCSCQKDDVTGTTLTFKNTSNANITQLFQCLSRTVMRHNIHRCSFLVGRIQAKVPAAFPGGWPASHGFF